MRFVGADFALRSFPPLVLFLFLFYACDAASDPTTLDPDTNSGDAAFVDITPGTVTIALAGQSVKLDASIRSARGRQLNNVIVLWETSAPSIAMVNADGTVTGLDVGSAEIRARVSNLSGTTVVGTAVVHVADTPYPQSAQRLQIEPNADTIAQVGGTIELKAMGYDGRNRLVANPSVGWFSLDPLVAKVANGKITALGKGAARILITNGSLADTAIVWVQPTLPVARVTVSAEEDTLFALGDTVKVTAAALDASGNVIAGEVLTLTVLDPSLVMIDDQANVVATGSGTARIAANYGKTSDTTSLAVAPSSGNTTISISPKVDTIPKVGQTTILTATTTGNAKVKWVSLDAYATLTEPGTVIGLRQGVARIVAKAGSAADTAIIWIAPAPPAAPVASVEIHPAADTINVIGGTVQLGALVLDAQNSPVQDQTVSWSTPDPGLVQVNAAGTVKGLAAGVALVIATAGGTIADTATIWVAPVPVATDLRIDPGTDTIPDVGASITLDAEAVDANGNVVSSVNAVWQSLDPSIADVASSGTLASSMLVTGRGKGQARIVATQQSMVDTAWVTVDDVPPAPQPTAVRVTPRTDTISSVGGTTRLTGVVLDQTGTVMTGLAVAWQPLDPSIATVSATGLVQGIASGVARIRAYYGTLADTAKIWVAPNPPPGTKTYTVPAAIDATGTNDVTGELLAFLGTVPDGSTIVFGSGATYRIEGSFYVGKRQNLTFEGNGAQFIANTDGAGAQPWPGARIDTWPRLRSNWVLHESRNIVIRNLTIRGANPNAGTGDAAYIPELEGQHGFFFMGASGVELDNVTVTDVYADFLYMTPSAGIWTSNVHIHNSTFKRNGRQGFAIIAAEDVVFERNYMGEIRRAAFDFEPNRDEEGAKRISIRDNTIGPTRLLFISGHGRKGTFDQIEFARNTAPKLTIVYDSLGNRRSRISIIDNVALNSVGGNGAVMYFYRIDGLTVRGNIQPTDALRNMTGVYVAESCNLNVNGNTFLNASKESEILSYSGCT